MINISINDNVDSVKHSKLMDFILKRSIYCL